MKILIERHTEETVSYSLDYEYDNHPGAGYSFECTEAGEPILRNDCARKNYEACKSGANGTSFVELRKQVHTYRAPAIGQCDCCEGEEGQVLLDHFTNTCDNCGADYNMSGQRLAPREQWGAETGESVCDILRVS